jgi:hypothetical protein
MLPKTRWDRLAAGSWFKIRTVDCRPIPIQSRILQPVSRRGNLRWSHDGGRMRDRSISLVDLNQLRLWIEPKPEVTEGNRYRDFRSSMICGNRTSGRCCFVARMPRARLLDRMTSQLSPHGTEGVVAFPAETWFLLHGRWPPSHRSMIGPVPRGTVSECRCMSRVRRSRNLRWTIAF